MPRHSDIIRPTQLELSLPEDLRAKLDLLLLSEVEGVVPRGAYRKFFIARLEEFFAGTGQDLMTRLDLGDLTGIVPKGRYEISGSAESIEILKALLEK